MISRMRGAFESVARGVACSAVVLALLAGPAFGEVLRVFAASSLTDAFVEIGRIFEARHPAVTVEFNFAGSQVLRTQIEQGARADVFASADRVHAAALEDGGLIEAPLIFARNLLVVVAPARETRVQYLADLAKPGVKIVLASPSVPAGRYTQELLAKMAASGAFGSAYRASVEANVASQETNVRAVLAKVSLGEADAGFVYRTDAAAGGAKIRTISIPESLNVIAEYPIGIVHGAPAAGLARQFVETVGGPAGQEILRRHGFARATP